MDAYGQYARSRVTRRFGYKNRRLAAMVGDFVYETSSAEDESRWLLKSLYERGKSALSEKSDQKDLERFAKDKYVSWSRMDELSQNIVHALASKIARNDSVFDANLEALDRMFDTTKALRKMRNEVDHRAPSDNGGRLQFYQNDETPVTARSIWGWTEVAASYWTHLTYIHAAISMATGIESPSSEDTFQPRPLQWPPLGVSIHGLRVLEESGIQISSQQMQDARREWAGLTRRWNKKKPGLAGR